MNCSSPGLPVLHHLLKLAQLHDHCISDAIQPSHPLMSSSPSALNPSHRQGLCKRVSCLHQMTKILELNVTTEKTIAFRIEKFVSKVMYLLFNMLSRFVITFLPRSNWLLISWLQSPLALILVLKKRKYVTASTFPPPHIFQEMMGPEPMILVCCCCLFDCFFFF